MQGLTGGLLAYAVGHLLASLVVVPVVCAAVRWKAIAPAQRAALLLAALAIVVIGPAIPLALKGQDGPGYALTQVAWSPFAETPLGDAARAHPDRAQDARAVLVALEPGPAAWIVLIWLAGTLWMLARLLAAHARLRAVVATSNRSHALEDAWRQVVPAGVDILVSAGFGPAAIGIVRPKIVLPLGMIMALPADAVRAVLLHEASHHRRKDLHALLAQRLVEAVFWWNPLVRVLGTASDSSREIACDIVAARAYGPAADYAEALLDAIAHFAPADARLDDRALCAAASLSTLDRRIDAIIADRPEPGRADRLMLGGVGTALALLGLAAAVCAPGMAVGQAVAPLPAPALHDTHVAPADDAALLALHDRHSQAVFDNHDRHSQALHELTESYSRELTALTEQPLLPGKEARLERLNQRYGRLFSDTQSRFRLAAARAEAEFVQAQRELDGS